MRAAGGVSVSAVAVIAVSEPSSPPLFAPDCGGRITASSHFPKRTGRRPHSGAPDRLRGPATRHEQGARESGSNISQRDRIAGALLRSERAATSPRRRSPGAALQEPRLMRPIAVAAGLAVLAGAAGPALAQEAPSAPGPAPTQTPAVSVYGSVGLSSSKADDGLNGADLGVFTGRLGAKVGDYWGVEAEGGLGTHDDSDNGERTHHQNKIANYIVGWLPVKKRLNLFARLNNNTNHNKQTNNQNKTTNNNNKNKNAQYSVTEKNGVRVEYLQQDFHESRGVANRWSLSFVRRFF